MSSSFKYSDARKCQKRPSISPDFVGTTQELIKTWQPGVHAYINWRSVTWFMRVYDDNIERDVTETVCGCGLVETWSVWDLIVGFYEKASRGFMFHNKKICEYPSNFSPLKKKDFATS
jgi:hypothetical protein